MGSIEDNNYIDIIIDKIGFALTKVDESIQKSIELWTELTKDLYDDQPTHDTTGQPINGKSGEENSSQDKSVAEVKERPIQHWAMCLADAKEIPSQQWAAMPASKIPESLIQEQGNDDYYDDDCDDYIEEKEKEDVEGTVSESSDEDIWECDSKTSTRSYWPNCYHHHNEEANGSSLRERDGYELLKNDDTSSQEEDDSWDNEEEVMEWMRKHGSMSDLSYESLVVHEDEDEDDLSDKLQGFVDVKEEEIANKSEFGEVETLSPECDWVYVTRN